MKVAITAILGFRPSKVRPHLRYAEYVRCPDDDVSSYSYTSTKYSIDYDSSRIARVQHVRKAAACVPCFRPGRLVLAALRSSDDRYPWEDDDVLKL